MALFFQPVYLLEPAQAMPVLAQPKVTLWAWDCPEDLSFLSTKSQAEAESEPDVAYFAGLIKIIHGQVYFQAATKKLNIPIKIRRYPTVRIESDGPPPNPQPTIARVKAVLKTVLANKISLASNEPKRRLMIDYDAPSDQRAFYTALLKSVRADSNFSGLHLSITALASWCTNDRWISGALCDEAIVMLFSMGRGGKKLSADLEKQHDWLNTPPVGPKLSIGISVTEPTTNYRLKKLGLLSNNRHLYLFNSYAWNKQNYERTMKLLCQP